MSFDKINILCQCWEFDHDSLFSDRSIFNPDIDKTPVGGPVDLMSYAIEIDKLNFSDVQNFIESGYNVLKYGVGDTTVRLSGIKNNKFLVDYFKLFDMTGSIRYRQYIIHIKYDGAIVFTGYINSENISEKFAPAIDSEIITVQILGIENLFSAYQSTCLLPVPGTIFGDGHNAQPMPWYGWASTENKFEASSQHIGNFLSLLFTQDIITCQILVGNWFVNNIPQMFVRDEVGCPTWFIKSGYKRFWQNGWTIGDLINKICNAMGWQYVIKNSGESFERFEFWLKNRSDFSQQVVEIDYHKFGNYEIGYQVNKTNYDHIVIKDGEVKTGIVFGSEAVNPDGTPIKIITSRFDPINEGNFFEYIEGNNESHYELHQWGPPVNQRYVYLYSEENNQFTYKEWYYEGGLDWHRSSETKNVYSQNITYIDGGDLGNQGTCCSARDGTNRNANGIGGDEMDIYFTGNCGSMLFMSDGNVLKLDYDKYTRGLNEFGVIDNQFEENYLPMLIGGNNQTVNGLLSGLILDPLITVKFINTDSITDPVKRAFFTDSLFAVSQLDADMIEETSQILLLRKDEE